MLAGPSNYSIQESTPYQSFVYRSSLKTSFIQCIVRQAITFFRSVSPTTKKYYQYFRTSNKKHQTAFLAIAIQLCLRIWGQSTGYIRKVRNCNNHCLHLLEYLFFEFDTKFFREVVNVMLTDLASMYLNAILNTKKLVDFKIIILFNCK